MLGVAVALLAAPSVGGPPACASEREEAAPESMSPEHWLGIREQIRRFEAEHGHDVRAATTGGGDAFLFENAGQQLRATFRDDGVHIGAFDPKVAPALELRFRAAGWAGRVEVAPAALPRVEGRRVEYDRSVATEWWVNDSRGLEQGFTFDAPPPGTGHELAVALALSQGWSAQLDPGAQGAVLYDANGTRRFGYRGLRAFDAAGRELPARMEATGDAIVLLADARRAVYPVTIDPLLTNFEAKLVAEMPISEPADFFGHALSISGDTLVVGAYGDDHSSFNDPGSAYVFERVLGSWVFGAKLIASDAASDDRFGWSVSVSGSVIVVGAYLDIHSSLTFPGSAYVFVEPGGGWAGLLTESAKLTASDAAANDSFGYSVAVAGDTVVVGALNDDDGGNFSGSAYVFVEPGGGWSGALTEDAKLTASDAALDDLLGVSVSVSGDTIAVGAVGDSDAGSQTGAAYVFLEPGGGWSGALTEDAKLTASDAAGNDELGRSISVSADTVVAGALGNGTGGSAYVFVEPGGGWSGALNESAKLTASDAASFDFFGASVTISGDTVAVGAHGDESNRGSVYVFVEPGGGWSGALNESAKATASDALVGDVLGSSVSISGDTVVAGSFQRQVVYFFDEPGGGWSGALNENAQTADAVPDGGTDDRFGHSLSISGDSLVVGAYQNEDDGSSSGSAYVFERQLGTWAFAAKLTASDAAAGDRFGWSVSISGDTVAVGAYTDDDGGGNSGSAYVFVEPAGGWSGSLEEDAKLTASDAAADDQFGYSVSISGGTLLVGARTDDDGGGNSGSAYVFVEPGGGWSGSLNEDAKLTASDAAANDWFGSSGAVSGKTIVVGASHDDHASLDNGSAYVFIEPGGGWSGSLTEDAKLTASDAIASHSFGSSVSLSGDTLVVGAWGDDDGGNVSGAAYVFVEPGGGWSGALTQTAKLGASDAAAFDAFGLSVSISGDIVLVGAYADGDGGSQSGSAYVFIEPLTGWSGALDEDAKLSSPDAAANDRFGYSVSISGDTAAVGATLDDAGTTDSGSAYAFRIPPPPANKMYWTDVISDEIGRADLDGSNPEILVDTGLSAPEGVALAPSIGKMYWTDQGTDKVQRANLNGTSVEDIVTAGLSAPFSIVVDEPSGKIYWTDQGTDKIQRADLDGSNVEDLVSVTNPIGIALDPTGAKMYWTVSSKVQRADLDGSNAEDLVTGLSGAERIAVDSAAGKMYWAEGTTDKIRRADLDGSNVEDVVATGIDFPIGIAVDAAAGKIYWTVNTEIQRSNLDGTSVEDLITSGFGRVIGVAVGRVPVCGNSILESGESCDDGNTTGGDCCSAVCAIEPAGTVCRAAADVCDVAETCDGVADSCPADAFEPATTECRTSAGACDLAELCTGTGAACPADLKSTAECRAAADVCDVAEICDGVADSCPADAFEPATTECRTSAGACDLAELCTGTGAACPADLKSTAECRAAADVCDVAEICDGVADSCPADAFEPATTECRTSAGACDLAELCTGTGPACPADLKSTAECRVAAGQCDVAEICDGVGDACPSDEFEPDGTLCDDGDVCSDGDECLAGACDPGAALDCDDLNDCTSEGCAALGGCFHDPIPSCTGSALQAGDVVVTDFASDAIYRIDPSTGDRLVVSSDTWGAGAPFVQTQGVTVDAGGDIIVADQSAHAIVRVDPITGDRTVLSSSSVGSGPSIQSPREVIADFSGDLLVLALGTPAILRVDPSTGDRTTVSSASVGSGPPLQGVLRMVEEVSGDLLVTDGAPQHVLRVDPSTGDRSVVSSTAVGVGTNLQLPTGIGVDAAGDIWVVDRTAEKLFRIDPVSGDRTVVSGFGVGSGPLFDAPQDLAIEASGAILVVDSVADSVIRVDPATGDRTDLSSDSVGSGSAFQDPIGIFVVQQSVPPAVPGLSPALLGLLAVVLTAAVMRRRPSG